MSFLSSVWDVIWSLLSFVVLVGYLVALFSIISDLFRDRELSGGAKAVWLLFLLFMPVITALVYLVVRGSGMGERAAAQGERVRAASDEYIRSVAGQSPTAEIAQAKELRDSWAITEEEFAALKGAALERVR